ncbi:MAG: OmpH family outer membrane protein [Flavobacteriaceae bacterium]|nr:OmpH family outer membrane protein [Flavobacteriaceae bacterium]
MKNIVVAIIVIFTFASCQQSQKIGFVDNSKLINEYQEKIDIQDKLQAKIKTYEARRDSVRQAFQLEINEAELKSRKMSQADLQKLSQELQQKDQVIAQRDQFEQQQIAQESQAQNDSLIKKVRNFVKDYGTKNGYDFILGSNEAGSVMYGKEASDLTQEILDALNVAYKKN